MNGKVVCDRCQLSAAEAKAVNEMRLMEKIGKGGGMLKMFWDGKAWKVTAIRK
jgi:hypothetical protein